MKRRNFLKAGAASIALAGTGMLAWSPRSHAATISKTYYITDGTITEPDGVPVYFKGYSEARGQLNVPAKPMIVGQGDTVKVTIVNTLATPHSFVIDGVVDSGSIASGQTKTIQFTVNTPGSYLFYDKLNAPYNRLVGLHGGFAVMPLGSSNELYPGSLTFVKQKFWVFHDIDPVWNDAIRRSLTPSTTYVPRYFTLNGMGFIPPGAAGDNDPLRNAGINPDTALHGHLGDRTLVRMLNPGKASHSVHTHANHMEWLTKNGQIRPDVWKKDVLYLTANKGNIDAIFPFEPPPDAYPPVTTGMYPMHLHNEMTQTAGGGLYLFGAQTDIYFE